jgi:hypothetical protein
VALITLALSACGSSNPPPTIYDAEPPDPMEPDASPPIGDVALAELPEALELAVCQFEARCGLMPDVATCREVFDAATTDVAQLAAFATAGRLTYDATKAGTCLTAYRDAACVWDAAGGLGPAAVCDEVFTGDKIAGVACLVDEECLGALVCETTACAGGCCEGICKAKVDPIAIGGDCLAGPCADGAYCRLDGATGSATCAARVAVGESCAAVDACAVGSACKIEAGAVAGLCVRIADGGESCDPALVDGCAGIDQWCDPASSTCVTRKSIGAACGRDGECVEAAACLGGTCAQRPKPGEACGAEATGGGCLGDLPCVSGLCAAEQIEAVCP